MIFGPKSFPVTDKSKRATAGDWKDKADQRHSLKEKAEKREIDREVSRFNRSGTRRT